MLKLRSILSIVLILILTMGMLSVAWAEVSILSQEQSNAIAILNYLIVLSQEVNASKNSRLYLESAYSSLIDNTHPNVVDRCTSNQLSNLLYTMEGYRMVAVKRDRLQYIYEQNQAQSIRSAIPNPLGMISAIQSYRPSKIAAALAYMAVDSITSYTAYTSEKNLQYLTDSWAPDDEERSILHESRKGTFFYMMNMVDEYDLPGDWTLTESSVEEFVKWKKQRQRHQSHSIFGIQSEKLSVLRRILAAAGTELL